MASPKHSRPSSRLGHRTSPASSLKRIQYTVLLGIVIILVIIYIATGETSTRNGEFYRRTVAMMEAHGEHAAQPTEDSRVFPEKPLHRAGGLHYAEIEGHGSLEERRRGKKVQGPQVLPEGMMGNPHAKEEHNTEDSAGQKPLMEDADLKERLRQAEEDAKKSADERYRGLDDIQAEVENDRMTRKEDASPPVKELPTQRESIAPTQSEKSVAGRKKIPADDVTSPKAKVSPKYPTEKDAAKEEEEDDPQTIKLRSLLAEILSKSPVTIFSKSYCPFSKKAKKILLEAYTITPQPFVVELNEIPLGNELQKLLWKTTGRHTVPNVLVNGKSIGGGDETEFLWKSGEIPARFKQMAGKRISNVVANYAFGDEPGPTAIPRKGPGKA